MFLLFGGYKVLLTRFSDKVVFDMWVFNSNINKWSKFNI